VITVVYEEVYAEAAMGARQFRGMRVMLGDRELARGHNPMGDACRLLIAEGHARTEEVQAYWRGSPKPVWKRGMQLRQFVGSVLGESSKGSTFNRVPYSKYAAKIEALRKGNSRGDISPNDGHDEPEGTEVAAANNGRPEEELAA
jgi:hypothetical protein